MPNYKEAKEFVAQAIDALKNDILECPYILMRMVDNYNTLKWEQKWQEEEAIRDQISAEASIPEEYKELYDSCEKAIDKSVVYADIYKM